MRKLGVYVMIIGLALIVLPYFGLTIKLLGEIDRLGTTTALAIKIGLIVLGAVLFFLGKPSPEEPAQEEAAPEEEPAE